MVWYFYYTLFLQKLAKLQISLSGILDEQKYGEKLKTHGDILAMHMLKEAQSLEKFTRLITEQYDTHCADYKCLQKFRGVITVCTLFIYYCLFIIVTDRINNYIFIIHVQEVYSARVHFFHLLHEEDQSSQLSKLYQQAQKTVMAIAEGKAKPSKLIKLAKER